MYNDGKKVGPWLRELASAAKDSQEARSRNLGPAFLTSPVHELPPPKSSQNPVHYHEKSPGDPSCKVIIKHEGSEVIDTTHRCADT